MSHIFPSFQSVFASVLCQSGASQRGHGYYKPSRSMSTTPELPKIHIVWEDSPNQDRHALLKAIAIIFRRRVPLSTPSDLTNPDKTLLCERRDNL
jgi:hypothetical protein